MVNSFSGSFTLTTSINHVNVQYLKCRTQWLWIFIPLAFVLKYATILNFKCDNGKAPNGVEKIESQAKQKTETTNILWFRFIHSIGKLLLIHCKWEDTHTHTQSKTEIQIRALQCEWHKLQRTILIFVTLTAQLAYGSHPIACTYQMCDGFLVGWLCTL